eukprot:CAMPEP_0119517384 /NCGR_PEP_ID=MMETSP1344-20130328/34300_1 /TAXON_ID=236787 /ORGANISM="Florenciella parvula, Strain CCMP2471" /LENGTH=38 /DNA_ID= /DNA_START= /DNA_END= /DNA_ORIENTATION=
MTMYCRRQSELTIGVNEGARLSPPLPAPSSPPLPLPAL